MISPIFKMRRIQNRSATRCPESKYREVLRVTGSKGTMLELQSWLCCVPGDLGHIMKPSMPQSLQLQNEGNKVPSLTTVIHLSKKYILYLKKIFYLFIFERGEGKERETSTCGGPSRAPHWGPGLQPRHVPWLGIEPVILGSQAGAQSTEPHQPGQKTFFLKPMSTWGGIKHRSLGKYKSKLQWDASTLGWLK